MKRFAVGLKAETHRQVASGGGLETLLVLLAVSDLAGSARSANRSRNNGRGRRRGNRRHRKRGELRNGETQIHGQRLPHESFIRKRERKNGKQSMANKLAVQSKARVGIGRRVNCARRTYFSDC